MSVSDINPAVLQITTTPFDNIGLAFSGGGYRAAAFSLGTLAYLNELQQHDTDKTPLLRNVTYMSSASGGTIATTTYALHSTVSKDFNAYYKSLVNNLVGVSLLEEVFKKLNNDAVWKARPDKKRNFINAFALAYDDLLFAGKTAASLNPTDSITHLQEVCFNTTDFYKGLLFRQAFKMQADTITEAGFLYGNYTLHLEDGSKNMLKLADILAASSCFPAGFEPIVFPGDFLYKGLELNTVLQDLRIQLQEVKWSELDDLYGHDNADVQKIAGSFPPPKDVEAMAKALQKLPIDQSFETAFMDGGITDNQGLESIMRANERREKHGTGFKPFDLMMVNDVASHYMDPYTPSVKKNYYRGIMGLSVITIMIICGVLICGAGYGLWHNFVHHSPRIRSKLITIFLSGCVIVPALVILLILRIKHYISGKLKNGKGLNLTKNFSEEIVQRMFRHFGKTQIGIIIQMLTDRFTSVLTLNYDVFLKRVRQLLYQQFMDQGRNIFRLKTNHIYDLSFSNDRNRRQNDIAPAPSAAMQAVAQHAFEMTTTLWFDTADQKGCTEASIIACGQFTTCYNLLEYIARMKRDTDYYNNKLNDTYRKKIEHLEQQLNTHYAQFQKDPLWLYNTMIDRCNLPATLKCTMANFPPPDEFKGLR